MKIEINEELRILNEARHDQKISLADFRTHRREIIENLTGKGFDIDILDTKGSIKKGFVENLEGTKVKQSPLVIIVVLSIITFVTVWLIN